MQTGLVSVIITTYHREFSMLAQAVESVLSQTYQGVELFVVSDNPPDSEWARAVREGMAAYPAARLIQLPKNGGAQVARNTGIRASQGEFVAFLDDDDLWLPEKLARQVPLFSDPAVGLVYCRGYDIEGNDRTPRADYANARWGFHETATFEELLVMDFIGSTSQAVIRRACFDVCGLFDEALRARQDYDRWLAITRHYRAVGVNEPLFLHRKHAGEQITKSLPVALASNEYVFKKYADGYRKSPEARMAYYYNRAFVLLGMGNRVGYLLSAARSFLCAPRAFVRKYKSYRQGE